MKNKRKKRYKREQSTYYFKNSIEVDRVCTGGYGAKGRKRQKRKKPTPEQIKLQNQYNKERKLRRIIKENFSENDHWVLLTYLKGYRTDVKPAKKDISYFIRILRREYRKRGFELKWVVRTEVGKRGAAHHHLLANRIPDGDILIKNCWRKIRNAGFPSFKTTYEEGGFAGLAWYITKPAEDGEAYSNYSRSRNMKIPEPKIERALKKEMTEYPKAPPGYYVDEDSVKMGINPITGYEYQHFIMYRIGTRAAPGEVAPVQRPGGDGDG